MVTLKNKKSNKILHQKIVVGKNAPENVQEMISGNIRQIINQIKKRGTGTGSIIDWIEDIVKVTIKWDRYLEYILNKTMMPDPENRSWSRYNKRLRSVGYTLPGEGQKPTISTVVILVDTSASMSKNDLAIAGGVIKETLSASQEICIIHHDTKINQIQHVDSNVTEDICHQFNGGGGTSHMDAFNHIQEMDEEIDIVVIISDFYSDINTSLKNKYPFLRDTLMLGISTPEYDKTQVEILKKMNKKFFHLTTEDVVQV